MPTFDALANHDAMPASVSPSAPAAPSTPAAPAPAPCPCPCCHGQGAMRCATGRRRAANQAAKLREEVKRAYSSTRAAVELPSLREDPTQVERFAGVLKEIVQTEHHGVLTVRRLRRCDTLQNGKDTQAHDE